MKEYILCAAVLFEDDAKHKEQPKNIDNGFVVCGRRHNNCFATAYDLIGKEHVDYFVSNDIWIITCGFITSTDRFVNREEASQIAFDANQVDKKYEILISEHLYND